MKPHTLAKERIVKPCVVNMADIIFGDSAAKKLKQVALSKDTVIKRINNLIINILDQTNLGLQGFSTENLVSTRRVYRCIQLQSVSLLCSL